MTSSGELATVVKVSVGLLVVPVVAVIGVIYTGNTSSQPPPAATVEPAQPAVVDPLARALAAIPEGPARASIHRGYQIVSKTFETLPDNVGNGLHCTSCHLDGGTLAGAGPWIGLPAVFPEFRARSGKRDPLHRRINDCFERSMNGTALAPESADMAAVLDYMDFISRDNKSALRAQRDGRSEHDGRLPRAGGHNDDGRRPLIPEMANDGVHRSHLRLTEAVCCPGCEGKPQLPPRSSNTPTVPEGIRRL